MEIIVFGLILLSFFTISPLANWLTHRSMTKDCGYPINKSNFKDFKTKFELIPNWEQNKLFPESLFCYDESNNVSLRKGSIKGYIHAKQFIFNEEIMLLGFVDYLQAWLLVRKKIKELNKNKSVYNTF